MVIIANIVGLFSFLFVLWKRLREDYHYEKFFTLAFFTLSGFLLSAIASNYLFKDYWFWTESLGIIVGFAVGVWRQKMRIWESFDAIFVGLLIWLSLVFFADSVKSSSLSSFLAFWVTLFCVVVFFFFDAHYRRFSWYKSGRVGFAGLATSGVFFLIRSIVALFVSGVISFVGSWEGIISGSVSFISFLLLFNLSRK